MKDEKQKFYGNPLLGTWRVPSTGKTIIPQLSYGEQRMIWNSKPSKDAFGEYELKVVEGIKWRECRGRNHLIPYYKGEKLVYDEAM